MKPHPGKLMAGLIAVGAIVVALAGAGGATAGGSTHTQTPSLKEEVAQATTVVDAAERAPTRINESVKLPRKPPSGKTVAWLVPGLSAATDLTGPIEAAAKQLGWR